MDNFDLRKYLAEGKLFEEDKKLPVTDYIDINQKELDQLYDRLEDEFDGDVEEFIEEYGQDFLSPNIEKISKYYGAKVLERDVRDDFFLADGLEFVSSNERFEKWLDRNKQFYLAEGKLLKEDYGKESLIKALGDADDAFIQLGDGREFIIYNPNSNNDDNVDMWGDYSVFAVDQDGEEHEILYSDITGINI